MRKGVLGILCFCLFQASCGNSILQYEFIPGKQILKVHLPELYRTEWLFKGILLNNDSEAYMFVLSLPNIPDASYADDIIANRLMENHWARLDRKNLERYKREWIKVTLIERDSVLIGHVTQSPGWAEKHFWPKYEEAIRILRKDPSKKNPLELPG